MVLGLVRGDRRDGDGDTLISRSSATNSERRRSKPFSELVTILPSLAVAARRLHDTDRTAWWLLLLLTLIGVIALIVWYCEKGTPGPNRFGPDPLPAQ